MTIISTNLLITEIFDSNLINLKFFNILYINLLLSPKITTQLFTVIVFGSIIKTLLFLKEICEIIACFAKPYLVNKLNLAILPIIIKCVFLHEFIKLLKTVIGNSIDVFK